ncbi:hypothetical protein VKT23_014129 [Stygiomarasmius scandens]|uniref:Bulb-type lectin domain-containing protein n=1 Tax=Marasmiellus scandens TaxID=2682957 RepID=A0ABR1J3Y6_9AGAR
MLHIEPFVGDGSNLKENPHEFFRKWQLAMLNIAYDKEKIMNFQLFCAIGSAAESWYKELSDIDKSTMTAFKAAFETRWPLLEAAKKTVTEYEGELLRHRLEEKDIGKKVEVYGRKVFTHIAWAVQTQLLVTGAGVDLENGLMYLGQVRQNLPGALQDELKGNFENWDTYLKAVKDLPSDTILRIACRIHETQVEKQAIEKQLAEPKNAQYVPLQLNTPTGQTAQTASQEQQYTPGPASDRSGKCFKCTTHDDTEVQSLHASVLELQNTVAELSRMMQSVLVRVHGAAHNAKTSPMSFNILFEGGHIFNRKCFPAPIIAQFTPLLVQMVNNVDLKYAIVDVDSVTQDLASQGYNLRQTSSVEVLPVDGVDPTLIKSKMEDLIKKYFEEDVIMKHGDDIILALIEHTIDNQVASFKDSFFSTNLTQRKEGKYYSYQMSFYSLKKASFCFLVLSLISFKDSGSVFGMETKLCTGISYHVQIFECKRIHNNVIYNPGRLKNGESMGSPGGKQLATLSNDGNLCLGSSWQSGTAGKGKSPWYLAMQGDANLVIYDGNNNPTWASNTVQIGKSSQGPFRLEMQDDGLLGIYDNNDRVLWAIR